MYVSELRETFHAVQVSFEGGLGLGISWKGRSESSDG